MPGTNGQSAFAEVRCPHCNRLACEAVPCSRLHVKCVRCGRLYEYRVQGHRG
jgi:phage FluMu protein Com